MRALNRTLYTLSLIGLALVGVGCGQDFVGKISCTDDKSCLAQTGTLFSDGSMDFWPQCCGGFCVLPAGGCESGYRYLNNDPGYGECAENPGCPAPPAMDLSMPQVETDMSIVRDMGNQG
jgi:hypothetical protein